MVKCDICHKEVDLAVLIHGFIVCDEECFNIAKEPKNFFYIQKAVRQGYPCL